MKKSSWLLTFAACASFALSAQAEFILWVSDNGSKGTVRGSDGVTRGAFYPAASENGTPFVDQEFVDLLIAAGHNVTRFNPNPTSMSIDDVPVINSYDVIILGTALNSGPFNLNARGAKWNNLITQPLIVTKSTLIRRDRMGYLLDNKEYDCAANESPEATGKLTFLEPAHPIFKGISTTLVEGQPVMDNHSIIRVGFPENNRGVSVQYYKLLIDGVEQTLANTVEPGGKVLASIDFNPLDPGANIPAGQAPTPFASHRATGYAIVEWPAGTVVRTTQTAGETNASYRLLFACGTRDASGSNASAPNPQVGAMDLSPDGQRMFLNAVLHAAAQNPRRLISSKWGEWDYKQYLYGGTGNLVLSDETSSRFTAWVGANDVDVLNNTSFVLEPDGLIESAGRPTIFQEFPAVDLSKVGQKITAKYDIQFHNTLLPSDQFVRFGFGNTNNNSAFYLKIDSGLGGGTTLGWRSDSTISDTNGATVISSTFNPEGNLEGATNLNVPKGPNGGFIQGNYSHFMNSGSFGGAYPDPISRYPNGVGLGVEGTLDIVHTVTMTMERVDGGLKIGATWRNSAGDTELASAYKAPYVDSEFPASHGRLDQIGCLGFNLMSNDLFGNGGDGGSYTVSNFRLTYVNPTPIVISKYSYAAETETFALTWNSTYTDTYSVEVSADLNEWINVASGLTFTGPEGRYDVTPSVPGSFYRIRRE